MTSWGKASSPLSIKSANKGRKKKSIEFVTLKKFDKARKERILNEVKILQGLSDPNVIGFINWYETRNSFWAIYEYLPGGNLASMITGDRGLTELKLKPIVEMLLSGLIYTHSQNIVFCDMKPGNFVFDEYANLKFADFSSAALANEVYAADLQGNLNYIAPELLLKQSKTSFKADMWSLGCLLYELISGEVLYNYKKNIDLVESTISSKPAPSLLKCSKELHNLLQNLLKVNVKERFGWREVLADPWIKELSNFQTQLARKESTKEFVRAFASNPPVERSDGKLSVFSHNTNSSVQDQNPLSFQSAPGNASTLSPIYSSPYPRGPNPSKPNSNAQSLMDTLPSQKQECSTTGNTNSNISSKITEQPNAFTKSTQSHDGHSHHASRNETNIDSGSQTKALNNLQAASTRRMTTFDNPFALNPDSDNDSDQDKIAKRNSTSNTPGDLPLGEKLRSNRNFFTLAYENDDPTSYYEDKSCGQSGELELRIPPFVSRFPWMSQVSEHIFKNNFESHLKMIREILSMPSNTFISPIIFNDDIEPMIADGNETRAPQVVLSDPPCFVDEQMKSYLAILCQFLASENPISSKMAVIAHILKIAPKGNVANLIAESYALGLLIELLKHYSLKQVKILLCSLIGVVLRHTTIGDLSINKPDLVVTLLLLAEENKNTVLKQRALGALGEFLVYLATQAADQNQRWGISSVVLGRFLNTLKNSTDHISLQYIVKTIENITSLTIINGIDFATDEFARALIHLLDVKGSAHLTQITLATLLNLLKLNPSLKTNFNENKLVLVKLLQLCTEKNTPIALNALNFVNHLLLYNGKAFTENMEPAILINWSKLIDSIDKTNLQVRSSQITLFILIFTMEERYIALTFKQRQFSEIIDGVAECLLQDMEHVQKPGQLETFSEVFVILEEVLKNYFAYYVQNFFDIVAQINFSQQSDSVVSEAVIVMLKYIRMVLSSTFLKERIVDEKEIILLFGGVDKISNLCSAEKEEMLDRFLGVLELVLRSDEILQRSHTFFVHSVLPSLIATVAREEKEDCRNLKFKIFIEAFHKVWTEEDTFASRAHAIAIYQFCAELLHHHDQELQSGALKIIRNLFEKSLANLKEIDPKLFFETLTKNIKNEKSSLISFNCFAIYFYILAEHWHLIYEYQKENLFEISVNYMLSHSDCEQFEEVFGFLNLYLEILHKLIKTKQASSLFVFNGQTLTRLLKFLDKVILRLNQIYIEDVVNIIYYIICIVSNGVPAKTVRLTPMMDPLALSFASLKALPKTYTLNPQAQKKFAKLNALL